MLRISDARMSGTHYGSCVLHVAPKVAVGGPLALVQTGDLIELDVPPGASAVHVDEAELSSAAAPPGRPRLAYARLHGAVPAACDAGPRGLRLRLPAGQRRRRPNR
jgi:dihydroxyacid dehydratase/phosphogluconate dehydratase